MTEAMKKSLLRLMTKYPHTLKLVKQPQQPQPEEVPQPQYDAWDDADYNYKVEREEAILNDK